MRDRYDEMCEIAECEFCDDQGIRLNQLGRCDHIDYGSISKRGLKLCIQELEAAKERRR